MTVGSCVTPRSNLTCLGMLAILLGTVSVPIQGQQRRNLALEDFYRFENVASPVISPDGRMIAFVRTTIFENHNRTHSEVWLVPSDGSEDPIRITSPSFTASGPQWSADGQLLAFSSNRRVAGPDGELNNTIWFLRMDSPAGEDGC
jgi:Tol biopolymer transport system component